MSILTQIQTDFPTSEAYSLQKGVKLLKINDLQGETQLAAICQTITENGYSIYDEWQDHGSLFITYTKGEEALYLTYHEKSNTLRLITDSTQSLPPRRKNDEISALASAGEGQQTAPLCTPLLTQGRLMYYAYDCGMQYIIRLTDGRFVIIDGGMCEYEEAEHFLDLLDQQNITGDKPIIAAWFITHPHDDHFNLFANVMLHYQDRIRLESLVYSWAIPEYASQGSDKTEFNKAIEALNSNVKIIQPHTGQRFEYGGATINILYTHEDACPEFLSNVNDTSIVMRVDFAEQEKMSCRAIFFGDAMFGTAERLCDSYASETLQCEIMQVAHHGYSGGSDRLYRTVDPKVILWPAPDYWFQTVQHQDCNYFLTHSEKAEALFIGGRHEVTLDLSQPIQTINPYEKQDNAQPGDVLYEEGFTGERIYDLNWSAINTGRTDYVSAKLTLQKGSCRLVAGEHHSMGELMQPGMLRKAQNWTLYMRGHAERAGMIALFWNYANPSEYNDTEALRLPVQDGEDFDIEFIVEGDVGKAMLKNKGELTQELTFTPSQHKGLYLILQNADITLKHIKVVKN